MYHQLKPEMSKPSHTYETSYKIRSYEVDHAEEASISTICNYFQEAAGLHAKELEFDISDLQKKGLTWILYKLQVKVHAFPKRWQSVRVKTWPSTGDGLRAYRDYELYNQQGDILAVGLSQWMVLDVRKKRPIKMPKELMGNRYKTDTHVLQLHKQHVKKLLPEDLTFITTAGLHDLDMNRHVNNVRYIDWITGYHFFESKHQQKCTEITIQYAAETTPGDRIYLASQPAPEESGKIDYTLFKNDDKHVIATATTNWS